MRGSVPRWVGIANDRRGRSADGAFYAADADVRETCASSRLSDGRTDAGDRAEEKVIYFIENLGVYHESRPQKY